MSSYQAQSESLASFHTFGFSHDASRIHRVSCEHDVFKYIDDGLESPLILGHGSNIVFTGDYEGDILCNQIHGRAIREEEDYYILTFASGESWHESVVWTVSQGIGGLENLALIPGTVGAAPVQNIGAYGVEFKDLCVAVEEIDLRTGIKFRRSAAECDFGYRTSFYKRQNAQHHMILSVELRLPKLWQPKLNYGSLKNLKQDEMTPEQVMDTICQIRKSKLPDPSTLGNAGSFFKNPVISSDALTRLSQKYPEIPSYPIEEGMYKVAAGWLIEQCGGKSMSVGDVAVHQNQALVLVNTGEGTSEQLLELAREVQTRVKNKFGLHLEPEVHFYQGRNVCFPL